MFFVSALEVASLRNMHHDDMSTHDASIEEETHVSAKLALNRLSTKALATLADLGGSYWYSSYKKAHIAFQSPTREKKRQ